MLNILHKNFHACGWDDSDENYDQLITFSKQTSSSARETRMPNVSSVASEIKTANVEEIDSFCSDAEEDNDDESTYIVHSTEPNEIDDSTKHDPIKIKSNVCSK